MCRTCTNKIMLTIKIMCRVNKQNINSEHYFDEMTIFMLMLSIKLVLSINSVLSIEFKLPR